MPPKRTPPIIIPPAIPPSDPSKSSAIIFIHGLNHDLTTTAWYLPTRLPPYPPSRPELEDDEDQEGRMASVDYIPSLFDDLVVQGVPAKRIVVVCFSQGHAMALLTGLVSKYSGRLGGLFELSGYLPLADRIPTLREKAGLLKDVNDEVERLFGLGIKEEKTTIKEYENMGHIMSGAELRDLCAWLEKTLQ
ncbi:acyl-protein thioesterase [Bipolaris maydis]|uniref:acyl-protein thioesterase n=1 Tax=Cochliobolus heterostrophus TaxID=5016 RepID=UPI0024D5DFC7|nr:acyl-protein thioesterase [Bipolaris maydis]